MNDWDPKNPVQVKQVVESYLVLDSSSDSKVFCRLSSSMRVTVTSFSFGVDSSVEMGGVTPR